jgi:hypothetical protein
MTECPRCGSLREHPPVPTVRVGDWVTYTGSDGARHGERVVALHEDGSLTVSRGYYGTVRTRTSPCDEARIMRR